MLSAEHYPFFNHQVPQAARIADLISVFTSDCNAFRLFIDPS